QRPHMMLWTAPPRHESAIEVGAVGTHPMIRRSQGMHTTAIVGLDIAESVFQVHGIDADGNVVVRRQLKRRYVLTSVKSCRRAWLASRPVRHRITGRVNLRRSVTPCA